MSGLESVIFVAYRFESRDRLKGLDYFSSLQFFPSLKSVNPRRMKSPNEGLWGKRNYRKFPIKLPNKQNLAAVLDTITISGNWPARMSMPKGRRMKLPVDIAPCVTVSSDASGNLESAECSLPRLLYGHNGYLLENQGQIDDALAKLYSKLSIVADVPDVSKWRVRRLDMAWNYNLPARSIITGHSSLLVPGINGEATVWKGGAQGISWKGTKSRFLVTFYDKARKMRAPGSILRAEVSLRGEQLRRRLLRKHWGNFSNLWAIYRAILASIPAISSPIGNDDWQEAVGREDPEIRARILARMSHKPERTLRGYKQRIDAAAAQLSETFSWENLLPLEGPPRPVNVIPRKTENRHFHNK